MKRVRVIATRSQRYGTRQLTAGDEFDVSQVEAAVMIWKRQVRFAPGVRTSPVATPQQQVQFEAEPVQVEEKTEAAAEPIAEPVVEAHPVGAQTSADLDPRSTLERLRAEAEKRGISVDGRWGVARLQYEISKT